MMTTETKRTPPYTSLATFKGLIQNLSENVTPAKIDRGVLSTMSGGDQTAVISALKYLGLIDDTASTLNPLHKLVDAFGQGPEQWKATFLPLLTNAYASIVGDFEIERGTYKSMADLFSNAGVPNGQMLEKTVRFYSLAMQDAGVKVSPFIVNAKGKSQAAGRPKPPKKEEAKDEDKSVTPEIKTLGVTPVGYIDQRVPLRGRVEPAIIRYPYNLTEAEYKLLAHAMEGVRLFALSEQAEGAAG